MTCVPEHDGKQEGKGGDRVHRGVDFPVGIGTVGIYQVLQIIKREKNILEKGFGLSLIFFFCWRIKTILATHIDLKMSLKNPDILFFWIFFFILQ